MGGGSERGLPPADAAPGLPEHPSEEVREESHLPRRIVRTASSPKRRGGGEARHCASADPLDRRIGPAGRPAPTSAQKVELRVSADAQADMPSAGASGAICVQRFDDSLTSCNSHYVSHFAAFFIVARAKISVVESCLSLLCLREASTSKVRQIASVCVCARRARGHAEREQ